MKRFAVLALLVLSLINCRADEKNGSVSSVSELQVLIDVSGSMKQNDPQNLRADATQLLINLLPEASKATLWLFAEDTKLLTEIDNVDGDWRQKALKATKSIHSHGVYTDIEKAIKTSLEQGFESSGSNNLIILTDGMVDISKDIMVSADSRERILSEWIPKLQERKIKVQTIGLSDQVDKELLEKLAFETGGWFESAESAEQLERLFIKSVQKAAPRDTLPLNGNQFTVDSSVREFSLLVFKTDNAAPTQLVDPDQKKLSQAAHADNVSWLETKRYDLITVNQPTPGDWRIEAVMDPDNQVVILTDLKMQLNEIPSFVPEKESLQVKLHFTEKDQLISRPDFLELVTIALSLDQQPPVSLDSVKSEPGYFAYSLNDLPLGKHNIKLIADGKTFKRDIEREFEVVSAPIMVNVSTDQMQRSALLTFQPDISVINAQSLVINVSVHRSNQQTETAIVSQTDGNWIFKLENLPKGESVLLNFDATAQSLEGKAIKPLLSPMTLDDRVFAAEKQPEKPQVAAPDNIQETITNEPTTSSPAQEDKATESEDNWLVTVGIILGSNILLGAIGFFAYRMLKKATQRKQLELLERLT